MMAHNMNFGDSGNPDTSAITPRERLLGVVRRTLGPQGACRPLPIDARLSELGISSIKMVSLMLAIEAEFNLTVPQEEITPENFASIGSMEMMLRKIGAR